MQYARPENPAGFAGALPLYAVFVFAVFAGVAWVLYSQLQPTVHPNPGVAVYKAPAATIVASAPARDPLADFAQAKPEAPAQPAAEIKEPAAPVAEAKQADPTPPAAEVHKKERKVAKRPRREHVARGRSPDPRGDYAAQQQQQPQYNNGFRPWNQAAQRPSGGFRPWF